MSSAQLTLRQVRFENRAFWRNPAAAFFTVIFPLMFLVIFNLLFGSSDIPFFGPPTKGSNFYVPAIAAFSIITACFVNTAMTLTFARDQGVLKRKLGTPMPPAAYLGSRIIHSVLLALLLVVVVVMFGAIFYDVDLPTQTLPAFLLTSIVGAATFCALGLAVTSIIPNADAAPAVINGIILPLEFISNIFIPLHQAPDWLHTFSGFFPVRHFADAMLASFNPFETGSGFRGFDLAVVAVWGVVGAIVAVRRFSWEPRR